MNDKFVIGVDFGTDSVRSIVVRAADGAELASSVCYYPRWKDHLFCDPSKHQFRQHPLDYIEGLEASVRQSVAQAGKAVAERICAISVDTTGSTPVAVNSRGTPLALTKGFENNPNAMFVLWKDHSALEEAALINEKNADSSTNFLRYVGGIYSSEWFWAKLLHVLRTDKDVAEACYSWVEHCDWIPFLLTGGTDVMQMKRSVCAAGHKALWSEQFGGLPPDSFFSSIDPLLSGFRDRLYSSTDTSDKPAGKISPEWAARLGLSADTIIGVGAFDAHMGAVGGQIEPYHLSKVMGTSTCDMLVAPIDDIGGKQVRGICGQVNGSIIPGMCGLEAGQSAFGDAYAWFRDLLLWPIENLVQAAFNGDGHSNIGRVDFLKDEVLASLSRKAAELPVDEASELAVDWMNGRRTPDADQLLKGAFTGITLASDAPRMFRALAEATCFGAKKIIDRFHEEDVPVKGLIGVGGVARKSPYIMQMMADVIDMPIRIHRSEQTCAAGAAMFAATVAGLYADVESAMKAMGRGFDIEYRPDPKKVAVYAKRYIRYKELGSFIEQTASSMKAASPVNS